MAAAVLQDEIARHSGHIADIAALHALQIGMEALIPAALRLLRLLLEHFAHLIDLLLRDDVPQADIVGIVRRDHDLHVAQRHLEDIVRLALPEDFTILDAGYHTSTMHRIDDLISYL